MIPTPAEWAALWVNRLLPLIPLGANVAIAPGPPVRYRPARPEEYRLGPVKPRGVRPVPKLTEVKD